MGVYSTLTVSERAAKAALHELIEKTSLEELGDMLDGALKETTLHNFLVRYGAQEDDGTLSILVDSKR